MVHLRRRFVFVTITQAPQQVAVLVRVYCANAGGQRPTMLTVIGGPDLAATTASNRYKMVEELLDTGLLLDAGRPNHAALSITHEGIAALESVGIMARERLGHKMTLTMRDQPAPRLAKIVEELRRHGHLLVVGAASQFTG